jgi:hypothetical protein
MHHAGGIVLLIVVVIIALAVGLSRRDRDGSSAIVTVLAAILGILIAFYLLRRL